MIFMFSYISSLTMVFLLVLKIDVLDYEHARKSFGHQ